LAGLIADDSAMHVSYTLRYERGDKNNTIIEVVSEAVRLKLSLLQLMANRTDTGGA